MKNIIKNMHTEIAEYFHQLLGKRTVESLYLAFCFPGKPFSTYWLEDGNENEVDVPIRKIRKIYDELGTIPKRMFFIHNHPNRIRRKQYAGISELITPNPMLSHEDIKSMKEIQKIFFLTTIEEIVVCQKGWVWWDGMSREEVMKKENNKND
jgi:hypothetical protein